MSNELFLSSVTKNFSNYKSMAEKAMSQLAPEELFIIPAQESNSIAIIVQHMAGNLLSRFTDFLTSDGEKEWRSRDQEFEAVINDKETLLAVWNKGWECLFAALHQLQPEQLSATVYIRKEAHSVTDAIIRQLAHHASHVGQIIYIAKMIRKGDWESLSIPKQK